MAPEHPPKVARPSDTTQAGRSHAWKMPLLARPAMFNALSASASASASASLPSSTGVIYVSPNCSLPPRTYVPPLNYSPKPNPWPSFYPCFTSNAFLWKSLLPVDPLYEGLLEPLANIDVVHHAESDTYRLAAYREWAQLEKDLYTVEQGMEALGVLVDVEATFHVSPWTYKYADKSFKTRRKAKDFLRRIRAVFVILATKLAYWGWTMQNHRQHWVDRLLASGSVSSTILTLVENSLVCQNTWHNGEPIPRRGLIVAASTLSDSFAERIGRMAECFSFPVWIAYDTEDLQSTRLSSTAMKFRPAPAQVSTIPVLEQTYIPPPPAMAPPADQVDSRPRNAATRQVHGQTWQQFFEEEYERNKRIIANETSDQKARRLKRQADQDAKQQSDVPWPTRRSSCSVFSWQPDRDDNLIRTFVSNKRCKDLWLATAPSQRRYNAVRDEWDVCEEFDPTAVVETEEERELQEEYFADPPPASSHISDGLEVQTHRQYEDIPTYDIDWSQDEYYDDTYIQDDLDIYFLSMVSVFEYRFGIRKPRSPYNTPDHIMKAHIPAARIPRILSMWDQAIPADWLQPVQDVLTYWSLQSQTSQPRPFIPYEILDVTKQDTYPLNEPGRLLSFRSVKDAGGATWYLFDQGAPDVMDVPWSVAVRDPLTANHLLRLNPDTVSSAANECVATGLEFKTLLPIARPRSSLEPSPPTPTFYRDIPLGLGVRMRGYQFTRQDLYMADTLRDLTLRTARGRAAFLMGGIVWRLALYHMRFDDVLLGPSNFLTQADYVALDGRGYLDDTLSRQDLDIICGVYRVLPDDSARTSEGRASFDSWWPPQAVWMESGYGVGHWTTACETWFNTHLRRLYQEGFQPKTVTWWRSSLKQESTRQNRILKSARAEAVASLAPSV